MTSEADLALLRRFEPVLRYTRGEKFFPMDVATYVQSCSLWVQRPHQLPLRLLPQGELTLDILGEHRVHGNGAVYFLKFIEPMNLGELAAYRLREEFDWKDPQDVFHAGPGRLARVGYSSRFVDALFNLTLLTRGRVPGDTAAAAALAYKQLMGKEAVYRYYGRVLRQGGWIALQYWFFYPFNDWRSGFYGANDHEADWEMIYVYLYEKDDGTIEPEWVAYASHDYSGDDLRRRWDDPDLEKVGDHPVVYPGAGSHASYYEPGEYLTELELPLVTPVVNFIDQAQTFWERNILYWNAVRQRKWSDFSIFKIPFIDYARGDGLSIGPEADHPWSEPVVLDESEAWLSQYRGLWGLYTKDPLSGEDAPAGPMFNRDGSVRQSWYAPLGWSGLTKVSPPNKRLTQITQQREVLARHRQELRVQIAEQREGLLGLGIERGAMQDQPYMEQQIEEHEQKMTAVSHTLDLLKAQLATDETLDQALGQYAQRIAQGIRGPARGHLRRIHHPMSAEGMRVNRFAETWAAISIGLMMVGFVLVVLFASQYLLLGLGALITVFVFIEATFRGRINRLINSVTVALAIVAALLLFFRFFWEIVVIAVLIAGSYIMWQNVRELRH
ncbi:MAG: hypothetical protein R6X32_06975 [Chloroflexota bacterium]